MVNFINLFISVWFPSWICLHLDFHFETIWSLQEILTTFTLKLFYRKCASTDVLCYGEKEEICKLMGEQEKTCKKENGKERATDMFFWRSWHTKCFLCWSQCVCWWKHKQRNSSCNKWWSWNAGYWVEHQTSQGEVFVQYCFSHLKLLIFLLILYTVPSPCKRLNNYYD